MAVVTPNKVSYYGLLWDASLTECDRLARLIASGGYIKGKGADLFTLYRQMQSLLWPSYEHNEWSDLILKNILAERITTVQGPGDSCKTNTIARYALVDYFCHPNDTLFMISSTNIRSLNLRVWGEIKGLFNKAREKWPNCPGNVVHSMNGIFTDEANESGDARDMRRGIICIPVEDAAGQWIGLGNWVGVKQKRRRVFADEAQLYRSHTFLSTFSNLNKGDFKGVLIGNPIAGAPVLDRASEPEGGWDSVGDIVSTTTWRNKMGGVTVQLYGPDSPGIKDPQKHPYLINQEKIDWIEKTFGRNSFDWYQQALGVRATSSVDMRVVPRDLAIQFGACEPVFWGVHGRTLIYAIDASYGGDRCVGGIVEFGKDVNGNVVLSCMRPVVIPVQVYPPSIPIEERVTPEDQIAMFVMGDCKKHAVPPRNVFFDSTGRGSLGTSFARIWSSDVNPVEFGGVPSPRPVNNDMWIKDEKTGQRRLKRADEHYTKRVSEYWFTARYAIEGRQIRNLPDDVLNELSQRVWFQSGTSKRDVEPKSGTSQRPGMKQRLGYSPDLADWFVIALEGARQRGFKIERMESSAPTYEDRRWKDVLEKQSNRLRLSYSLVYN